MSLSDTHAAVLAAFPRLSLAASLCLSVAAVSVRSAPEWEDQTVFRINKEEPHATKMPFPDAAGAMAKSRLESPWCLVLNGEWKFSWAPDPDHRPAGFEKTTFDDSGWKTIPVPANVELHGYGTPIYTNITYPFKKDPPRVMGEPDPTWTTARERNPVSSYRRTFTLPADWSGREVFIVFNGVASAFNLFVNGERVGYSQDSRTPAEFNLTRHLQPGENLLAVEVFRYSDGSYLEDQDFWRLSGIFRDVYLWSSAPLDLRDFEIHATLEDDYRTGKLSVTAWTKNASANPQDYTIDATLLDSAGQTIAQRQTEGRAAARAEHISTLEAPGLRVDAWSAEIPTLYSLLLTLRDGEGREVAHYASKIGFRRSEIKRGNLLVNGQPVLIKGVNRHDFNHLTGQYVTEESMRADLEAMKRLNINTIRTSHYPNDPRFLELVDEYGFYVISEANIESHGMGYDKESLAKDPSWGPAHLDRVRNMVETLKNHACIVFWSLGNEAGNGENFQACSRWVRERDPSRPVHYEQAGMGGYVDVFAPMYFKRDDLLAWCREEEMKPIDDQRPMIQCEYSHAMGNSMGGLAAYWELIRRERLLQGGSIWDWRDQGILRVAKGDPKNAAVAAFDAERYVAGENELHYFAYGGDFGDAPNDGNFCCNGIVHADLTPNPHATEVFHQYRNLLARPVDLAGARPKLAVFNELFFKTLEAQRYRWALLEDGAAIQSGEASLPAVAPQSSVELELPLAPIARKAGAEYHVNVEFLQGEERAWAPADFVVAREQFALAWTQPKRRPHRGNAAASVTRDDAAQRTTVKGPNFTATIDDRTGRLLSYRVGEQELLAEPLKLNFWRPPTDNDRGNNMAKICAPWRDAGDAAEVVSRTDRTEGDAVGLTYELTVPVGETSAQIDYAIAGDGVITVSMTLRPSGEFLPLLPRIGMTCALRGEFKTWSWFGRGPGENYRDRNSGTPVGQWSGPVNKLWYPYVEPGETANRTDIRWSRFTNAEGRGLCFRTADDQWLEMGAYPFLAGDLEGKLHPFEIPLRDLVTVHIAHAQLGVGGENSWGLWPLAEFRLPANREYRYAFEILPVGHDER